MNIESVAGVLLILIVANGAPIIAARLFAKYFSMPIDRGRLAHDGNSWLGPSKTWRGLVSAYLLTMPFALWLGFSITVSFYMVSLSMLGDLTSSFIKRRLGLRSSSRAILLDQVPEAGLPLLYLWLTGYLSVSNAIWILLLFILIDILLSKLLFYLHIRKRPY